MKGVGIDCAGLLAGVASDIGYDIEDYVNYAKFPDGKTFKEWLDRNGEQIEVSEVKVGDVLVFWIGRNKSRRNPRHPWHTAIKTDRGMIHADNLRGVIEHRLDSGWQRRIVLTYRFWGVVD